MSSGNQKIYPWMRERNLCELETMVLKWRKMIVFEWVWVIFWGMITCTMCEGVTLGFVMASVHMIFGIILFGIFVVVCLIPRLDTFSRVKRKFYDDVYWREKRIKIISVLLGCVNGIFELFLILSIFFTDMKSISGVCIESIMVIPVFLIIVFKTIRADFSYVKQTETLKKKIRQQGKRFACLHDMIGLEYSFAGMEDTTHTFMLREDQLNEIFSYETSQKLKDSCNMRVFLVKTKSQQELKQIFDQIIQRYNVAEQKLLARIIVLNYGPENCRIEKPQEYRYYENLYFTNISELEEIDVHTVVDSFINEFTTLHDLPVVIKKKKTHIIAWAIFIFFSVGLMTYLSESHEKTWVWLYIIPFIAGVLAFLRHGIFYKTINQKLEIARWAMYISYNISTILITYKVTTYMGDSDGIRLWAVLSLIPLWFLRPSRIEIKRVKKIKKDLKKNGIQPDENKSYAVLYNTTFKRMPKFFYDEDKVYGTEKILKKVLRKHSRKVKAAVFFVEVNQVPELEKHIAKAQQVKTQKGFEQIAIINLGELELTQDLLEKHKGLQYGNVTGFDAVTEELLFAILNNAWLENQRTLTHVKEGADFNKIKIRDYLATAYKDPFEYIQRIEERVGFAANRNFKWDELQIFLQNAILFENIPRSVLALYDYMEMCIRLVLYYEAIKKGYSNEEPKPELVSANFGVMARKIYSAQFENNEKMHKDTVKLEVLEHCLLEGLENELHMYFEGDNIDFNGLANVIKLVRNKIIAHGVLSDENVKSVWSFSVYAAMLLTNYLNMYEFVVEVRDGVVSIGYGNDLNVAGKYMLVENDRIFILAAMDRKGKKKTYVNYFDGDLVVPSYMQL